MKAIGIKMVDLQSMVMADAIKKGYRVPDVVGTANGFIVLLILLIMKVLILDLLEI